MSSCTPVYDQCIMEGQTTNLLLKLHNPQNLSYNLTGYSLYMRIKRFKSDEDILFSIAGEIVDRTTGMVFFRMDSMQTASMTAPTYQYQIVMTTGILETPDTDTDRVSLMQGTIYMEARV